jgi:hypothetical protein
MFELFDISITYREILKSNVHLRYTLAWSCWDVAIFSNIDKKSNLLHVTKFDHMINHRFIVIPTDLIDSVD